MYARSIIRARSLVRVVHGTLESMWKCVASTGLWCFNPVTGLDPDYGRNF